MSQELPYLKEEQSQFVRVHAEQTNKVVSLMLLVWGGFIVVLGNSADNFLVLSRDNVQLYFIGASVFFISMVVLYSLANKYYRTARDIFNIVAYILVFYERRPSSTAKVSDNFCWQTINCENGIKDKKGTNFMSGLRSRDNEYLGSTPDLV